MNRARTVLISTFLARHLRHSPERIGIVLDARGRVPVSELLTAAERHGFPFTRAELEHVVANNDKRRYAIEGDRIRAHQGHTVPVDLGLPAAAPPARLHHGTVARNLAGIRRDGLRAMARHAVHLSPDHETAVRVGARRGDPVVLVVDAAAMHADGHEFRLSANGVWLVDRVPASYLAFPL